GRDVTDAIRRPAVHAVVAQVASLGGIRAGMVDRQRSLAEEGGVVMDGRDIGTYVLPHAPFKFFLTASLEARVARRHRELAAQGFLVPAATLQRDIVERDRMDSTRAVAPLQQAPDAHVIDTTNLTADQVVQEILAVVRGR
ncbi:MAG: (d)CMP kinase, partial [Thermaerobacter sp.]|nr:(d)CMP kinase [Thermaerobacter sp.]